MMRRVTGVLLFATAALSCKGVDFVARDGTTISVTANPKEIAASNGVANITAVLNEMGGIPVADKTVVRFTTTLGAVTAQTETQDGIARAILTSNGTSGTATVTAFSGSITGTVDITIGVTASSIALASTPANLGTGGGSVSLTATVFAANGAPVAGASVAFSTTQGSLGSAGRPVVTDASGVATDTLTTVQTAVVTAVAGGQNASITINVGASGVSAVVLAADSVNLPAGGGSTGLVAVVLGDSGPVPGVAVAWSATNGSLGTPGVTVTDSTGKATNSLTTSRDSTVRASASGFSDSVMITVGATTTLSMTLAAERASIPLIDAPYASTCASPGTILPIRLAAQLQDSNGNPVAGREVQFFIDFSGVDLCGRAYGEFCDTGGDVATAVSNGNGVAEVQFTMTDTDILFCNCLRSATSCSASAPGACPGAPTVPPCSPICRTTSTGTEDLFCQVAFLAVSGGTESGNSVSIEYGR